MTDRPSPFSGDPPADRAHLGGQVEGELVEPRHAGALANALRESEARFRKIYENAATGIAITDWEGNFQQCNRAYAEILGYTEDELRRLHFASLVHPDDREANVLETQRLKAGEIPSFEVENRYVRKSGEPVWVHKFVSLLPDETGKPAHLVALVTDITERKETDSALRESEAFYRRTLESIPGMTFTTTAAGVCDYVSEQWVELTGVPAPEHLGDGWLQLVHPEDRACAIGSRRRNVESRGGSDLELRIRRRDGEYEWFKVWCRPLRDASGTIVRWLGTAVNIDGLKRTEAALRESEERLRETDRHKDEFLATLAHELRNPLAPLQSGLHVLRRSGGKGPAAERSMAMMERQVGQLVRLIEDLLDLSRISRGKVTLRKERAQLAAVVRQAVETSRPNIEQAGHELSTRLPPEPIEVDGDPTRLAQVLSNLLNNAAKFTDKGGHIELSVGRRGGEAVVSVRDSGVGIPPAMLDRVFEMFTQVDSSIERSRGGLGIGLSLVKQLVELHGGSVEAYSEGPGKGSVFTVHLPLAPPSAAGEAPGAGIHNPAAHRILVVDDNEDAAVSLAMLLDMTGHITATARDGLDALDVAEAFRPDVVLLDIGMPRMNGYDAARELRKRPWGHDLLLVALTGWGQDEDRRRSRDAGFDHHLVKPVDLSALEKVLSR